MSAEKQLAKQGVFKGHDGLRGLADADEFWSEQPYGTRLYFGSGITQYLHRGVLQCAVKALDEIEAKDQRIAELLDSEESAWGIIANAYGGNWELANKEWREAAIRWRDKYVASLRASEDTHKEPSREKA